MVKNILTAADSNNGKIALTEIQLIINLEERREKAHRRKQQTNNRVSGCDCPNAILVFFYQGMCVDIIAWNVKLHAFINNQDGKRLYKLYFLLDIEVQLHGG